MKMRPKGFLAPLYEDGETEIGDYVRELHDYLWRVVRAVEPGTNGRLTEHLDSAVERLESHTRRGE